MQKVLTKYGLAAHLAFLAVAPLFLSAASVLWLTGLAGVWLLMEPSRIYDERLHESRQRVVSAIVRDLLFWVALVLVTVEGLRWINDGIARRYDAETTSWQLVQATFSFLPGSVAGGADEAVACSLLLLVMVMGCRHALGKAARMTYCCLSSLFAGCVAAYWVFQLGAGNKAALDLAGCSLQSPSYVGCLFGCQLLVALVGLVAAFELKWRKLMIPLVLSMGALSAGLFLFAPIWCQLVFVPAVIALLGYSFVYARRRMSGAGEFKLVVFFGVAVTLGVVISLFSLPASMMDARVAAWTTGAFFPKGYWELRSALNGLSLTIWKGSPWLGGGLGAFALNLQFIATDADWQAIPIGQIAPLSGYWCLLAEQGIVGALLIACPIGFLAWTYARQLVRGVTLALPHPACWLGPIMIAALLVDALWDITSFGPHMLLILFPALAISANSFPKERHDG